MSGLKSTQVYGPYSFFFFVRHLAIAGRTGHVSTFDWQTGTVHAELQLQETCRDITYGLIYSFEICPSYLL